MSEVLSRKERIIKYCFKSRRSIEIAEHLGINVDHVRRYIREMIVEGTMSKLSDDAKPNNHGVRYISTGKPIVPPEPVRAAPATYNTGFTVMGVRL
jgi:hypothetical protein